MAKKKTTTVTLKLDPLDWQAVNSALVFRSQHPIPDGTSNRQGALLAEICRSWLDMLGKWEWACATGKVSREVEENGGEKAMLKIRKGDQS